MNGSWEERITDFAILNIQLVAGVIMFLCLFGAAMGTRYLWRNTLRPKARAGWNKLVRNPTSRTLAPIRRLHRQWSASNLRADMAKWKKELVANMFYDTLTKAVDEHVLSKHDKRRLMKELSIFFGIADLRRPNNHMEAIKKKILANTIHETGPAQAQPAWGGKPGEDIVPIYKHEGLGSKFLGKKVA